MTRHVLICLPDCDFDPTEVATPWHRLREAGFRVTFATEQAAVAAADRLLLTGVVFGKLGAESGALERYYRMVQSAEFQHPRRWRDIAVAEFDALLLPGGHAQGMKQYLESLDLRAIIQQFFAAQKIVAAICHGVLAVARTPTPASGLSVLNGYKVTALLTVMERAAYYATFWKLGKYYRTYPEYVQQEVTRNLANKKDFIAGDVPWKPFALRDRNVITARYPKDAEIFAAEIIAALA